MRERKLKGVQGRLYDRESAAWRLALDHLRDVLLGAGFVVDKRRERERTLRVYPLRRREYPLLNPFWHSDDAGSETASNPPEEVLGIAVLSKGNRPDIDRQFSRIGGDHGIRVSRVGEQRRHYRYHGYLWVPLQFSGPTSASKIEFAAMAEPLSDVYRAFT